MRFHVFIYMLSNILSKNKNSICIYKYQQSIFDKNTCYQPPSSFYCYFWLRHFFKYIEPYVKTDLWRSGKFHTHNSSLNYIEMAQDYDHYKGCFSYHTPNNLFKYAQPASTLRVSMSAVIWVIFADYSYTVQ